MKTYRCLLLVGIQALVAAITARAQSNYEPYTFTTFAGKIGYGSADGISTARFDLPSGTAVDVAANVYVADSNNHTIREINPSGVVTTWADLTGSSGSADGIGSASSVFSNARVRVISGFSWTNAVTTRHFMLPIPLRVLAARTDTCQQHLPGKM